MTRIHSLSRKQYRRLKKGLMKAMCMALIASNILMYMPRVTVTVGGKKMAVSGPVRAKAAVDEPVDEYTRIDISELPIMDNKRLCSINKDGAYILTGSNYDSEEDVYITTQIVVEKNVNATIYMEGLNIHNADGTQNSCSASMVKATSCMIINGNCKIKLLDDSSLSGNYNGSVMQISEDASVILEESEYSLDIKMYGDGACGIEDYGKFIMNGSRLNLNLEWTPWKLTKSISYLRKEIHGKIVINGGYLAMKYINKLATNDIANNIEINGGQFNNYFSGDAVKSTNNTDICIDRISGLPSNAQVETIQHYYNGTEASDSLEHGKNIVRNYNSTDVETDENGEININTFHPRKYDISRMFTYIKCNGDIYKVSYMDSGNAVYGSAVKGTTDNNIYELNLIDMNTGERYDTVYTDVDADGTASVHAQENEAEYSYTYYKTNDKDGEIFDYTIDSDNKVVNVYVDRQKLQYTITNTSSESAVYDYGTKVDGADDYILIYSYEDEGIAKSAEWDGIVTKDISGVRKYPCTIIDGVKYMNISSKDDFESFRDEVNEKGATELNAYVTASDIDLGNWEAIGTKVNQYRGSFKGNFAVINLAIEQGNYATAPEDEKEVCSLFGYVGRGAFIEGVCTYGTIVSDRPNIGGVIGEIDGLCTVARCSSEVEITYNTDNQSGVYVGGVIGHINSMAETSLMYIDYCSYKGEIKAGTESSIPTYVAGIVGGTSKNIKIISCFVKTEFTANEGTSKYAFTGYDNDIEAPKILRCYYISNTDFTIKQGFANSSEKTISYYLNADNSIWSFDSQKGIVFADNTHKPTYCIIFTDPGVYHDKSFTYEQAYTDSTGHTTIPSLETNFLEDGHIAGWKLGDIVITEDTVFTSNCTVKLYVTSTKSQTVSFTGDYSGSFSEAEYGMKLKDMINDSSNYVFMDKNGNIMESFDGTCKEYKACKITTINEKEYYVINNLDGLKLFAELTRIDNNVNGYLNADIDASLVTDSNEIIIGNLDKKEYKGIFEGNGHKIKINIVETNEPNFCGFFRCIGAGGMINNLRVDGNIKTNATYTGGIVGDIQGNSSYEAYGIKNCISTVDIEYTGQNEGFQGGLVGIVTSSYIYKCQYVGKISSKVPSSNCSGIAGLENYKSYYYSCYTDMTVELGQGCVNNGKNVCIGGDDTRIKGCYNTNKSDSSQGTLVEKIDSEIIYEMNSQNKDKLLTDWSYYDEDLKVFCNADSTHKAPCKVTFVDSGVYSDKTYATEYKYTDINGNIQLPDTSEFLDEDDWSRWYVGVDEITSDSVIDKDCTAELVLKDTVDIRITGDMDETITDCYIGERLQAGYYYYYSNGVFIDKVSPSTTSITACQIMIVNGVEYFGIDSLEKFKVFTSAINAGLNLNGILTADIDTGSEWTSIGTGEGENVTTSFGGIFEGNGFTVKLGITDTTDKISRTLFGYVSSGAVIRNLKTTGSIVTSGKYTGGIIGDVHGECTIENCGSDVDITFTPGGDASAGGIIGIISPDGKVTMNNCYFTGSMQAGKDATNSLSGQGGLVGWNTTTLNARNCFVNGTFVSDSGSMSLSRNGGNFTNCYYVTGSLSGQGNKISAEDCKKTAFAYNLNTTNGTEESSDIWTYVEGADTPSFCTEPFKSIYKVIFKDESNYYDQNLPESVIYVKTGENVTLPDITTHVKDGDNASWYVGDEAFEASTIITKDCTLNLRFGIDITTGSALVANNGTSIASETTINKSQFVSGESVTATTNAINGYTFKGWYSKLEEGNEYTGTPISTKLTYVFDATKSVELVAVYEENAKANVGITGDNYSVKIGNGANEVKNSEYNVDVEIGNTVTLTTDDPDFVNWTNDTGRILSDSSTYSFNVTSNIEVKMNKKGVASTSALVQFISNYNQVIESGTYNADNIGTLKEATAPSLVGFNFTRWTVVGYESLSVSEGLAAAVMAAIAAGETNVIIKPVYEEIVNNTRSVKVYMNGFLDKTQSTSDIKLGDTKTVTAQQISGKKFKCWAEDIKGDKVLSFGESYFMQVSGDVNLYAIYVDDEAKVNAQPVISITNKMAYVDGEKNKVTFVATRNVTDNYTVVEHGILYSKDGTITAPTSDTFVIDGTNVKRYISSSTGKAGVFNLNVNVTGNLDTVVHTRAYMIIRDNESGNIITIYSNIESESYNALI